MWSGFGKASLAVLIAYAAAVLIGAAAGYQLTLGIVPVFQVAWTVFCIARIVQLRRSALAPDRESFGFAVGGLVSSCVLLLGLVVATQVV